MSDARTSEPKRINLALQGGGSHGAFTWGVLDALLEDGRLEIDAITGTSAGAMNAVVMLQGLLDGGREGARAALAKFWDAVCQDSAMNSAQRAVFDRFFEGWGIDGTPLRAWLDVMGRMTAPMASPYIFNPLNVNPLRDYLVDVIDFEKVRACNDVKLFVAATNVHTGRIAIFERTQLTVDHILASACLPTLFHAVEIDGTPYWDGGYLGNPALFPLFYKSQTPDVLVVQINPIERPETPRSPREIENRLNEITFNGALMGEFRAIDFVNRLIESGRLSQDRHKRVFMHRIDGAEEVAAFSADSKFDTRWSFLTNLRDIGRRAGAAWLEKNFEAVGQRATLDLRMAYN